METKTDLDFSAIDQKDTPLFMMEMEGLTELESILACLSEWDALRLADFSRDPNDPNVFPDKILIDRSLKKKAKTSEIEYYMFLLKHKDVNSEEL